jgi:hypothetical protein
MPRPVARRTALAGAIARLLAGSACLGQTAPTRRPAQPGAPAEPRPSSGDAGASGIRSLRAAREASRARLRLDVAMRSLDDGRQEEAIKAAGE